MLNAKIVKENFKNMVIYDWNREIKNIKRKNIKRK